VAALFSRESPDLYLGLEPPSPAKLERLRKRERRVCRRASALVAITGELRRRLEELHGPLALTRVIPDGTRYPASAPPIEPRSPEDPLRVSYIGQLYPWKGIDTLLAAMQKLPDAQLVVVGGLPPEPDLERARRLAEKLGVAGRTVFRGYLSPPEARQEQSRADVLVIPLHDSATARYFTSPLKLFEAMAAARPIIASDLPSVREVLTDGVNALLVPPGDPEALAAAITRLRDDEELRQSLGRRAGQDAVAYAWAERARSIAHLVQQVALGAREEPCRAESSAG
jgi:glycosyltransferase involved in cell wall biosynthesis